MKQDPFEGALRSGLGTIRAGRGPCPDHDTLLEFADGQLPADRAAGIQQHIDSCGKCDYLVTSLARFDAEEDKPEPAPARWRIFESLVALLRHPALAYGLVLLLAYPAYLGLFHRSITPAVSPEVESAPSLDLTVTRSVAAAEPTVTLGPSDRTFVVAVPVQIESGKQYSAQIVNESTKKSVTAVSSIRGVNGKGGFNLVCQARNFPAGQYTLIVKESGLDTGKSYEESRFAFLLHR